MGINFGKAKFLCQLVTKIGIAVVLVFVLSATPYAAGKPKRTLKGNMIEIYNKLPENASTLAEIFTKGMVYGRIRVNHFRFYWDENSKYDPKGFALGGSIIYKTAPFYGVSATVGLYTAQNLGLLRRKDAKYGKSGKDTFSRYRVMKHGHWGMTNFAQVYLEYCFIKTDIKVGRQIFESFLTKSNDTKMIPNTFQGVTLVSKYIPATTIKLAYFNKQKLRDHLAFHDVITYGRGGGPWSKWRGNDDSAVHKGLSYANLKAADKDVNNELIIAGITNKSIKNLKLDLWYNGVPDLFFSLMGEANYTIPLRGGWTLTPGFRYMEQFDDGAGRVGGAALTGSLAGIKGSAMGYDDADSVDGRLYGARLVLAKGPLKFHLGYTKVTDDADLIAPWRGFPTGGYTRSMAQYNWEADTESWMVKLSYDFDKANLIKGFRMAIDYAYMNYDDTKEKLGGIKRTDRYIIHTDMWYRFPFPQYVEAKVRIGLVEADNRSNGEDPSYNEFRFELNYLF